MTQQDQRENEIKSWATNFDIVLEDAIRSYFREIESSLNDRWEVAIKGERVWRLVFNKAINDPERVVLHGVAAAAYDFALKDVAKLFGVSASGIKCALDEAIMMSPKQLVKCHKMSPSRFVNLCRERNAKRRAIREMRKKSNGISKTTSGIA